MWREEAGEEAAEPQCWEGRKPCAGEQEGVALEPAETELSATSENKCGMNPFSLPTYLCLHSVLPNS